MQKRIRDSGSAVIDKQTRREFLRNVGFVGAGLAGLSVLPGCAGAGRTTAGRRPNIIFVLADDLGYGDLGCYGQKKINTPNLDSMAAEGMRFTQHYAGNTVCAPSRCTLMTGRHTGHCYVRGNMAGPGGFGELPIPDETVTAAELLKEAGYITGAFGKWGLGAAGTSGSPVRQGFDEFFGYLSQVNAHFYYPPYLWRDEQKVSLEANGDGREEIYSHDAIAAEALGFIERNASRPFFLYVPFTIPHAELRVPADSLEDYRGKFAEKPFAGRHYGAQKTPRAAYAAMVSRMDGDVGRILELLKRLDIDKDTIVMFSSDNGPHREGGADPSFFDSTGGLRGIKRDLYEGGIRVPLIVRWPGRVEAGSVSDHISAFWDFLPSCAELAGLKVPEDIDGISMVPTLLGRGAQQKKHRWLYWEFHEQVKKQALRMGDYKAVRLNVHKQPDGPVEVYNLKTDPGEQRNCAAELPDIAAKLSRIMDSIRTPSEHFPLP